MNKTLKNQKGFTLIEIIAVLVILGILAAVAIPKFFNLQTEARAKGVQGALAALQATAVQLYAKQLLNGMANASSWTANASTQNIGDYWGTMSGTQQVTLTVTGPANLLTGVPTTTKVFNLW